MTKRSKTKTRRKIDDVRDIPRDMPDTSPPPKSWDTVRQLVGHDCGCAAKILLNAVEEMEVRRKDMPSTPATKMLTTLANYIQWGAPYAPRLLSELWDMVHILEPSVRSQDEASISKDSNGDM